MVEDDDFQPRFGRLRSAGTKRAQSYLGQVIRAANLAGGIRGPDRRPGRFHGNRSGVGVGVGRVLATRDRLAAFRQRRVMVKFRIGRVDGLKGLDGARAHLRYIRRDGVTRDGSPGELYAADTDRAEPQAFLDRATGDRHQFRVIVSPEDGDQYLDLKDLTRRLMAQMEQDLGTRLDWVAVDHFNTGHPHTHIIIRGKDERGRDLVVARDYIAHGLRERAAELVSLDLGPRANLEIEERLRRQVEQERLTDIDRRLLRDADRDRIVSATGRDPFQQSLRAGRLRILGRLGLAEEVGDGRWRLADGLDDTLRRMGERGDIVRTLQRAFTARGQARAPDEIAIADPATMTPLVGRLVERGLSDELDDRHYLIVDGVDGRSHYVEIGRGADVGPIAHESVLRIAPRPVGARSADHTVARIAAAHDGRYSIDIHLRHDRTSTQTFAETHVRRLEAMRRVLRSVERDADGSWIIAPDHIERAAAFEAHQARDAPMVVDTLSTLPLGRQVGAAGATWLDRELLAAEPLALREAGFGRDARDALDRRRQWLVEQGLARQDQDRVVYRADLLAVLRRRELSRVAEQLSDELGLAYREARTGDRVEGLYRRPVELASGRYALIETSREFTLVPWRPALDRHLEKSVSGIMRDDAVSWTIGRQRGPSVS